MRGDPWDFGLRVQGDIQLDYNVKAGVVEQFIQTPSFSSDKVHVTATEKVLETVETDLH